MKNMLYGTVILIVAQIDIEKLSLGGKISVIIGLVFIILGILSKEKSK